MTEPDHPVISEILSRAASQSLPGRREDDRKIGLVIEGGGMRSVVTAGMLSGLESLDLLNSFDSVYAVSAGAISGAYFVAGHIQYGTSLYYEIVNNRQFIDALRFFRRKPIMDLDVIFHTAIAKERPLDWRSVIKSPVPLNVVAYSLDEMKPVVLSGFTTRDELFGALRATATIPVIAGRPLTLSNTRYVDGGISDPIPLRFAVQDGCTHILVLLSEPAGVVPTHNTVLTNFFLFKFERIAKGWANEYRQSLISYFELLNELSSNQGRPIQGRSVFSIFQLDDTRKISTTELDGEVRRAGASSGMKAILNAFGGRIT